MKIASDVMGTIDGPKQKSVIAIIRALVQAGHDVTIWSGSRIMADETPKKYDLTQADGRRRLRSMEKMTRIEASNWGEPLFDLAIEDEYNQTTYLASKHFLMVKEISEDPAIAVEEALKLVSEIAEWNKE